MTPTSTDPVSVPALPQSRGPLSDAVITMLSHRGTAEVSQSLQQADPYGDDLALALHICYELHYRGFRSVAAEWEWDPDLLRLRAELENRFLSALRADTEGGTELDAALDALLVEPVPGDGVSHHLRDAADWRQVREYLVHRSIYHLKEADPHVWVIPRLQGQAKASLVAVEFDEFGAGRGSDVHAQLFANTMEAAGLCPEYLHYLDDVPAPAIAIVNLMSMLGLHRNLRGALVGHFTAAEISTAPSAQRITAGLERMGAGPECTRFFTEHIEADAVHEQIMRHDVVGDLLAREPQLTADVVFGIQATELLEGKLAGHLLNAWTENETSLYRELPAPA